MSEKPRHPEKVNKPINPIKKKPEWIRSKILDSQIFFQTKFFRAKKGLPKKISTTNFFGQKISGQKNLTLFFMILDLDSGTWDSGFGVRGL